MQSDNLIDSAHSASIAEREPLPAQIVDSHGLPMDVSQGVWRFNVPADDVSFNFDRHCIKNEHLLYGLKRHLIYCARRVSPREAYNIIVLNVGWMSKTGSWAELTTADSLSSHQGLLGRVMSEALALMRRDNVDYNFHRLRAWYSWCTDFVPDCGFDPEDAYKWERVQISGNEKGVAVRRSDPTEGPLNDAELILLRKALQRDESMELQHIFERSAVWLALVYGRNPANFCLLRQHDFHLVDDDDEVWVLDIPRIKKRALPRAQFKEEYVAPALVKVIRDQMQAACRIIDLSGETPPGEQLLPLFPRFEPRTHQIGTAMHQWAWHRRSTEFTQLIQAAVKRYGLISPRTNEPLFVTTRRLRYTFATNRVREGISARDLAEALDHSDLQHVRVYFDARSTVVERLDAAVAKEIAPKLRLFEGELVRNAVETKVAGPTHKRIRIIPELIAQDHHVRDLGECGKEEFCNLFPPYSCYPCSRFRPFEDSAEEHEAVFDFLIKRRERLRSDPLEQSRIAVQLDEVIYACAEVIVTINDLESKHAA